MIDQKQRHILEAVVQVLAVAGINPWFEARLIKDSGKKLNGKRISSKTKTDLASVLKVADEKRVNMLPNYRMELRMYATVGSSRTVFMGQEMVGTSPDVVIPDEEEVRELPKGKPIHLEVPVLGVLNVDNPRDPRHQQWGAGSPRVIVEGDPINEELGIRTGRANYSPAKNVERLRAEGLAEDDPLMVQAKDKADWRTLPARAFQNALDAKGQHSSHTCDANGPMRQRDSDGPFVTTCSICGDFNEATA